MGQLPANFSALIFASYFFFCPAALVTLAMLYWWNFLQFGTIAGLCVVYLVQLVVYRPHLGNGWAPRLLYSALDDLVLHYYDGTCMREGLAPDPKGKYVFACYPHGVYGVCRAFSGGLRNWEKLYPGITARWGSFGMAFYIPGVREFSLWAGCIDASKPVLMKNMNKYHENVMLLPGGIDEMQLTDSESKDTQLVMTDRMGYAKLAIETGSAIVPGFCFGEKWIHKQWVLPRWLRAWLYKTLKLSGTLLKGRGPTFLGYIGVPLGYVWGEPIEVTQQEPGTVDDAYLQEVHNKVQVSVRNIFDKYKSEFGYADDETLTYVTVSQARAVTRGAKKQK